MRSGQFGMLEAIALVLGCVIAFTLLGAGTGYALGTVAPGYYRSVFEGGQDPNFDPVDVGIGLGSSQGLLGGAVIGVLLASVLLLRDRRAPGASAAVEPARPVEHRSPDPIESPDRDERRRIRVAALVGAVLGAPVVAVLPGYLWQLEQWLKPGPPTDMDLSTMFLSAPILLLMGGVLGPFLGAACGAAGIACRLHLLQAAGRWCIRCGAVVALPVTLLCLASREPAEQIGLAMLPWRWGHLFLALLLIGWGLRLLPSRR
jgi:hypothetical protein